jgi:hypothetical protein
MNRRLLAIAAAGILSACAPYDHEIAPAPISSARYDGRLYSKLAKEHGQLLGASNG